MMMKLLDANGFFLNSVIIAINFPKQAVIHFKFDLSIKPFFCSGLSIESVRNLNRIFNQSIAVLNDIREAIISK